MGCINSTPSYIASSTGTLQDYQKRYLETKTLGEGQFGVVKLAHDVTDKDLINSKPLAVKYLRKGFQFKDNTIYSPIKKEMLVGEVEILQRLNGECFNLKLISVYETPALILIVTEFCEGGELIPYVTNAFKSNAQGEGGLRTEDVSRISYQLFSAVNHCAKHGVIHRDIKPENVMFCTTAKDSELRLIDYGSGTLDGEDTQVDVDQHHTFAGSAFYISPEMFQRTYTSQTDVWSAAVTLYVLVAGYPAERLQECFNILQSDKPHRLRSLPNIPPNMPNSFYKTLEGALVYWPKGRSNAGQLMNGEFAQFHIAHSENPAAPDDDDDDVEQDPDAVEESTDDLPTPRRSMAKTKSVLLTGAVGRHSVFLGYQAFERSVTTILATMLPKEQCKVLMNTLRNYHPTHAEGSNGNVNSEANEEKTDDVGTTQNVAKRTNASKLQVVPVKELVLLLEGMDTLESKAAIQRIQSFQAYSSYANYAYHISMFRQFVSYSRGGGGNDDRTLDESQGSSIGRISSVHAGNVWSTFKSKRNMSVRRMNTDLTVKNDDSTSSRRRADFSVRSQPGGGMGMRRVNTATGALTGLL